MLIISEPEFRLPFVVPGMILTLGGLFGFGYAVEAKVSVYLVAFIWGMMITGIIITSVAANSYVLDAYRDNATQIFIMGMLFKNFMFYGLSNFINNWVAAGISNAFNVMGAVAAALVMNPLSDLY